VLVEVAGPSGAGKTVLSEKLIAALRKRGVSLLSVYEDCANRREELPRNIARSNEHNIKTDLVLLPWTLKFILRHPRFVWFSLKTIVDRQPIKVSKWDILRAFWRKCGLFAYLRRRKFIHNIVIVDEGLFHCAQLYLVHPNEGPDEDSLRRFAHLIPLPDRLIIVNKEPEVLYERSVRRDDFYPSSFTLAERRNFAENGYRVFSYLSELERFKPLLQLVAYTSDTEVREIVDELVGKAI